MRHRPTKYPKKRLLGKVIVSVDVAVGSIAPNAARVLQQQMSVAPRKRQLATKVRRVVKGQSATSRSIIR
jgi:hypothetical protein